MNIQIEKYKHFSFDMWLTLIKSNPSFKLKRNQLIKDYFSVELSFEKVCEVVRYYDLLCNQMNEKTGLNIDTDEMYLLILSALDVDIQALTSTDLGKFYLETEELFFKYKPEIIDDNIYELFNSIQVQGKTLSILSNTALIKGETLRKILEHYELNHYFSFQLYSDETGISKPNIEFFNRLIMEAQKLHNNTLKLREIVHLGDNPIADDKGAQNAGIQSILI